MHPIRTASAVALALALAACSDAPTTAPSSTTTLEPASVSQAKTPAGAPSTTLTNAVLTSAGAIVGSFTGTVALQSISSTASGLVANLLVTGSAIVNGVVVPVVNQVVQAPLTMAGTCPVLDLDIGAIHLNLLGLVVDLAPVHLDIVAQSGPGALLGNLLCAVVHLLDGTAGGGLGAALTNLLNQINAILAGL